MRQEYTTHGVTYIRTGQCNRCGACEKDTCPHYSYEDGLATCAVHETKNSPCQTCTTDPNAYAYKGGKKVVDHRGCAQFPTHPWLRVIRDGQCGYIFTPASKKDAQKHAELVRAFKWQ